MTDESAFIAAVLADPDDDAPRLIYADWLDEQGQCERAEFIRVQCAIAHPRGCAYCHGTGVWNKTIMEHREGLGFCGVGQRQIECSHCDLNANILRERGLWSALYRSFDIGIVPGAPMLLYSDEPDLLIRGERQVVRVAPRRGFVTAVTCTAAGWIRHADAILARQPVEDVTLTTMPDLELLEPFIPGGLRPAVRLVGREKWFAIDHDFPPGLTASDPVLLYLRAEWPRIKTWRLPPRDLIVNTGPATLTSRPGGSISITS